MDRRSMIKMVINKNNDIIITQRDDPYVYICDDVGQLKQKFEATTFEHVPTLDISEKNEIITSCWYSQDVKIYTETFHHAMGKIIVLTRKDNGSCFLLSYSESGELGNTTFVCKDIFIYDISMTSHPSGPVVVVKKKSIMFI